MRRRCRRIGEHRERRHGEHRRGGHELHVGAHERRRGGIRPAVGAVRRGRDHPALVLGRGHLDRRTGDRGATGGDRGDDDPGVGVPRPGPHRRDHGRGDGVAEPAADLAVPRKRLCRVQHHQRADRAGIRRSGEPRVGRGIRVERRRPAGERRRAAGRRTRLARLGRRRARERTRPARRGGPGAPRRGSDARAGLGARWRPASTRWPRASTARPSSSPGWWPRSARRPVRCAIARRPR